MNSKYFQKPLSTFILMICVCTLWFSPSQADQGYYYCEEENSCSKCCYNNRWAIGGSLIVGALAGAAAGCACRGKSKDHDGSRGCRGPAGPVGPIGPIGPVGPGRSTAYISAFNNEGSIIPNDAFPFSNGEGEASNITRVTIANGTGFQVVSEGDYSVLFNVLVNDRNGTETQTAQIYINGSPAPGVPTLLLSTDVTRDNSVITGIIPLLANDIVSLRYFDSSVEPQNYFYIQTQAVIEKIN